MATASKAAKQKGAMAGYGQVPEPARTASSPKKSGAKKLSSIHIEVAENGYTARCNYDSAGDYSMPFFDREKEHVFESADAVLDFVKEKLGSKKK